MLKHLPDDVLATFQDQLLYSKKKVIIKCNAANSFNDRRNHISASARNSNTDDNLEDRISKFNDDNALSETRMYRIPLKYLADLGLVNLPTEFDVKFIFNLEKNRSKLFESRKKIANLTTGAAAPLPTDEPDADVHYYGALTRTAQDFFHTLSEFAKIHKRKVVDVFMVDDCLQNLESDTCGLFQLYFYVNLLLPTQNSKILNNKNLTINTIQILLNEIFVLDVNENERRVENFGQELDIKRE